MPDRASEEDSLRRQGGLKPFAKVFGGSIPSDLVEGEVWVDGSIAGVDGSADLGRDSLSLGIVSFHFLTSPNGSIAWTP